MSAKPERRRGRRVPVRLPVSIGTGERQPVNGLTRDLSTSGIFLYADTQILEGSELEMVLLLPEALTNGEKQWVCCQASVIRVEAGEEPGRFGVAASIRSIVALPQAGN
jgi:hypothetical protein